MNNHESIKNYEFRVGMLAVASILALILGYYFLKDVKIFTNEFTLKSHFENVNGLSVGNPVFQNGARIGAVRDLEIDKHKGDIIVTFSVTKGMDIPVDSKVLIYDLDLLGTKAMKIIRGSSSQFAGKDFLIEGRIDKTLSEQVKEELLPAKDRLLEIIEVVDSLYHAGHKD